MTYEQIAEIVKKMNSDTATDEEVKEVEEWADIEWGYDSCEEKYQYKIVATYSYTF